MAVSCDSLTKVVTRAVPFQFTVAPETNPVPFTVSVNLVPPRATASGTSGWLTKGTGFCASAVAMAKSTNRQTKRAIFMATPGDYVPTGRIHITRQRVAAGCLRRDLRTSGADPDYPSLVPIPCERSTLSLRLSVPAAMLGIDDSTI